MLESHLHARHCDVTGISACAALLQFLWFEKTVRGFLCGEYRVCILQAGSTYMQQSVRLLVL